MPLTFELKTEISGWGYIHHAIICSNSIRDVEKAYAKSMKYITQDDMFRSILEIQGGAPRPAVADKYKRILDLARIPTSEHRATHTFPWEHDILIKSGTSTSTAEHDHMPFNALLTRVLGIRKRFVVRNDPTTMLRILGYAGKRPFMPMDPWGQLVDAIVHLGDIRAHFENLTLLANLASPASLLRPQSVWAMEQFERYADTDLPDEFATTGGLKIPGVTKGKYRNVHVFDVSSMFPCIVAEFGIDPRAVYVGDSARNEGDVEVVAERTSETAQWMPRAWVCRSTGGPFLDFVRSCVRRRFDPETSVEMKGSIKFMVNQMIGCLNQSGGRVYAPRAYACVQVLGRQFMRGAIKALRTNGLVVVYADTDSVFVTGEFEDARRVLDEHCAKFTWLRFKHEVTYSAIQFLRHDYLARVGDEFHSRGLDALGRCGFEVRAVEDYWMGRRTFFEISESWVPDCDRLVHRLEGEEYVVGYVKGAPSRILGDNPIWKSLVRGPRKRRRSH